MERDKKLFFQFPGGTFDMNILLDFKNYIFGNDGRYRTTFANVKICFEFCF